ncbi:MAG: polyprenol phosphomannose-dependent alpha 1,6 mannosyltransferase MptB [Jatrophihabitantaceae bacterium]
MNDLAELALHELDVARKHVAAHPLPVLSAAGFSAAAVSVYFGGRVGPSPASIPMSTWLGLQPDNGAPTGPLPAALMLGAIIALVVLWIVAMRPLRRAQYSDRHVWTVAGIWSLPFIIGPPLLSSDVYTDVAHGLLARSGRDPYTHAPSALGNLPVVAAIDPNSRSAASTSGPVGSFVEHLTVSVTGGQALAGVLVLRAVAVLSVVAVGLLAAELAGPRRVAALTLTVLNPAVLLLVVSGAHLEGLLAALLLAALLAATQRRWVLAILLACAGAGIKPVALIAVAALLVAHCRDRRNRLAWTVLARDGLVAVAGLAACVLCVGDGLGWARNLDSLTRQRTPFSVASAVGDVLSPVVAAASFDDLAAGGSIVVVLAAVCLVAYLLVTVSRRPLDRTVGFALLGAALLGPVLYPWYLLWGLFCLAPTAAGARRHWVVALSCAACVLMPVGFSDRTAQLVTGAALAVIALVLLARLRHRHRPQVRTPLQPQRRAVSGG